MRFGSRPLRPCVAALVLGAAAPAVAAAGHGSALHAAGAFGFPQADATRLYDTPELSLSAWSNDQVLLVQAVIWNDGDDALGKMTDGRATGDLSALRLDVDADGQDTPDRDRVYSLDPWPAKPGLWYQVVKEGGQLTHLTGDSAGRGSIGYVPDPDPGGGSGRLVRVDSFLIPLDEIGAMPGGTVRLAYWAQSPSPPLVLNSVGFRSARRYYSFQLPLSMFHSLALSRGHGAFDPGAVPAGRDDAAPRPATRPALQVGDAAPEISAGKWFNIDSPPTPAALRERVVLVEFWSPTCGTCVDAIPALNRLNRQYGPKGLAVIALTSHPADSIERTTGWRSIEYIVGADSGTPSAFGITGLPRSYLLDRRGKVLWSGREIDGIFEDRLAAALAATP